jgi:heterodisulfide reductase subunit A2
MVIGGGISGMQTELDMADSGVFVYLVERLSSNGRMMSQIDKTFPTIDPERSQSFSGWIGIISQVP